MLSYRSRACVFVSVRHPNHRRKVMMDLLGISTVFTLCLLSITDMRAEPRSAGRSQQDAGLRNPSVCTANQTHSTHPLRSRDCSAASYGERWISLKSWVTGGRARGEEVREAEWIKRNKEEKKRERKNEERTGWGGGGTSSVNYHHPRLQANNEPLSAC